MKFCYLVPRTQYDNKTSRVRFHQIEAIGKIVETLWTGPGWDNYQDHLSVEENLKRLYKGKMPTLAIVFDYRPMIDFHKIKTLKCVIRNEMHDPDGSRENALQLMTTHTNADIVICHHLNEMLNPYFHSIRNKLFNIPHSANEHIFKDYNLPKTTDVLLCGSTKIEKYQLRKKMVDVIQNLQSNNVNAKIHQHPGGWLPDAATDRYLVDFAKAINQSKICLTCSSIYKCVFGKYVEIPMCNSLLCGDVPDERQEFFRSFMLEVHESESVGRITQKIINQLNDLDSLQNKTKIGFEQSQNYTMEKYAERFVQTVQSYINTRKIL